MKLQDYLTTYNVKIAVTASKDSILPPFGGRNFFCKISGATSSRGHTALAILRLGYISVLCFLIEPFITFSTTLYECLSDTRE